MSTEKTTYIKAIADAVIEEMRRDADVFVIGEDVDISGGVYNATEGIYEAMGEGRLWGTPISESGFCGIAAGAAMTGLRPVVEIMYFDFVMVAMDQLVNQIAKMRLMSGGGVSMPVTIRAQAAGIGTCEAAQHSQSLEAWFVHVPGIKVVMPATVYDAKGLLKSAIRDDSPVLYIENRNLYYREEEIPDEEFLVPIGEAEIVNEGSDITVVACGRARETALKVVERCAGEISVELIDPRTLHPFDIETVSESVKKTGRVLIVHEAPVRGGIGAEIERMIIEHAFDYLDAPPCVLGGLNVPVPFSPGLERACYPQEEDILRRITELMKQKI